MTPAESKAIRALAGRIARWLFTDSRGVRSETLWHGDKYWSRAWSERVVALRIETDVTLYLERRKAVRP